MVQVKMSFREVDHTKNDFIRNDGKGNPRTIANSNVSYSYDRCNRIENVSIIIVTFIRLLC